jgi:hypothetical protein
MGVMMGVMMRLVEHRRHKNVGLNQNVMMGLNQNVMMGVMMGLMEYRRLSCQNVIIGVMRADQEHRPESGSGLLIMT